MWMIKFQVSDTINILRYFQYTSIIHWLSATIQVFNLFHVFTFLSLSSSSFIESFCNSVIKSLVAMNRKSLSLEVIYNINSISHNPYTSYFIVYYLALLYMLIILYPKIWKVVAIHRIIIPNTAIKNSLCVWFMFIHSQSMYVSHLFMNTHYIHYSSII